MTLIDTDLRDLVAAVLEDNHRRPVRVQANAVVNAIRGREGTAPPPAAPPPEPPRWSRYAERNAKLLNAGVATTRNRVEAAMHALGLEPHEIRAVVIEPSTIHVFRWTDGAERIGIGLPIVPD